ncbi:MAG TPA: hypothetical protein IAB37_04375, partial [Candidatus Faecivivens stercoravium]|nr:hypothetical protein [Candidatus Faecivivens stercoravium]
MQYIARFPEKLVPQKIVVSCFARNAGHAVRPANNFLRAAKQTGVQQHPNNTKKDFFDKLKGAGNRFPGAFFFGTPLYGSTVPPVFDFL